MGCYFCGDKAKIKIGNMDVCLKHNPIGKKCGVCNGKITSRDVMTQKFAVNRNSNPIVFSHTNCVKNPKEK